MSDPAFEIEGAVLPALSGVYTLVFIASICWARRLKAAGFSTAGGPLDRSAVALPFSFWGRFIGLGVSVSSLVLGFDLHGTVRYCLCVL
jgi:hypothetical protein